MTETDRDMAETTPPTAEPIPSEEALTPLSQGPDAVSHSAATKRAASLAKAREAKVKLAHERKRKEEKQIRDLTQDVSQEEELQARESRVAGLQRALRLKQLRAEEEELLARLKTPPRRRAEQGSPVVEPSPAEVPRPAVVRKAPVSDTFYR